MARSRAVTILISGSVIERVDRAVAETEVPSRAQFVREAILDKIKRLGRKVDRSLADAQPRPSYLRRKGGPTKYRKMPLIAFWIEGRVIDAMDRAATRAGVENRAQFIRDAACEKLVRMGFRFARELAKAYPRRGGRRG